MKRLTAKEYYFQNNQPKFLISQPAIDRFVKMIITKTANQLGYSLNDFEYEYAYDTNSATDNVSFSLSLKETMPITEEIIYMLDVPKEYINYCLANTAVSINNNHGYIIPNVQILDNQDTNFLDSEETEDWQDMMNEDFQIIINQLVQELQDKFTKFVQKYDAREEEYSKSLPNVYDDVSM